MNDIRDRTTLRGLINQMEPHSRERCLKIWDDNAARFERAWGSSKNHQAWPGGYLDHVTDSMSIATVLYRALEPRKHMPFSLEDALLVIFLHDIEKPWKREYGDLFTKDARRLFRRMKIKEYDFLITPDQENALRYAEGEGDDYRPDQRVMNELAAFVHICDVASARIYHSVPFEPVR